LHSQATSLYERSWRSLSSRCGLPYPSSAVFARDVWPRKLSLLLCEIEPQVAKEIESWLRLPEVSSRLDGNLLHQGDWRTGLVRDAISRFHPDVILTELDPMQFERRNPTAEDARKGGLLYPDDVSRIGAALQDVTVPVVLQISSYDVNNDNSLADTVPVVTAPLQDYGFQIVTRVQPNDQMISLIASRNLSAWQSLQALGQRFNSWLTG
jgi:hypothetical protein